jgi:hypothetical protein
LKTRLKAWLKFISNGCPVAIFHKSNEAKLFFINILKSSGKFGNINIWFSWSKFGNKKNRGLWAILGDRKTHIEASEKIT